MSFRVSDSPIRTEPQHGEILLKYRLDDAEEFIETLAFDPGEIDWPSVNEPLCCCGAPALHLAEVSFQDILPSGDPGRNQGIDAGQAAIMKIFYTKGLAQFSLTD